MAMIFDSEEEETLEGVLDEDSDENDEDYVPDKKALRHSDSDTEYSPTKREKVKSPKGKKAKPIPTKSTRATRRNSAITPTKPAKKSVKTVAKTPPSKRKSSARSSKQDDEDEVEEEAIISPLRRSSRSGSQSRSISYADADVSDESMDEEDIVVATKKTEERKKRVDNLWSSFKEETSKPTRKAPRKRSPQKNTTTALKANNEIENEDNKSEEKEEGTSKLEIVEEEQKNEKLKSTTIDLTETDQKEDVDEHKSKDKIDDKDKIEIKDKIDDKEDITDVTKATGVDKKVEEEDTNVKSKNEEINNIKTNLNEKEVENKEKTEEKIELKTVEKPEEKTDEKIENNKDEKKSEADVIKDDAKVVKDGKVEITESYDFAGEEIKVKKLVDAKSLEKPEKPKETDTNGSTSTSGLTKVASGLKRGAAVSGLSGVLGSLEKKKKISVLDKSKLDWNSYKDDAGLEDELKSNRNAGYLDKQEFLQRVDYKQWENEREMRLMSNRK